MKCHVFQPSTVHLTDIINGQKKELHSLPRCAEQQQLMQKQEEPPAISSRT